MSVRARALTMLSVRVCQAMFLVAGLVAGLGVLLGGCGAGPRSSAPAAMAPAQSAGAHDEIARLWDEIDAWRGQAGTAESESLHAAAPAGEAIAEGAPEPAGMAEIESTTAGADSGRMSVSIQSPDAACPAAASGPPECRDSCTLATSICDNAGRICRIAQQLAGDDWAAGKCTDASAVCRQATADCCGCRAGR